MSINTQGISCKNMIGIPFELDSTIESEATNTVNHEIIIKLGSSALANGLPIATSQQISYTKLVYEVTVSR